MKTVEYKNWYLKKVKIYIYIAFHGKKPATKRNDSIYVFK